MGAEAGFRVRGADWRQDGDAIAALRTAVFIDEQRVPPALEHDGLDPDCVHVLAEDDRGVVIGTGRLLPDGRIGRMAVHAGWRGRGVGRALLEALLARARAHGHASVELHAQTTAMGFYERAGFIAEGAEFDEAGLPHRRMRRALPGHGA